MKSDPPLQDHRETLLSEVKALCEDVVGPQASEVDAQAAFPSAGMEALKNRKLLSAYVPQEFGGLGLSVSEVSRICEELGRYCPSTAMIYAMHQIQVACVVHHGQGSEFFRHFLKRLVDDQLLLASATTEIGVGGDLTRSRCHIDRDGNGRFTVEKRAPVVSYGAHSDAILVTARRDQAAEPNDQVLALVEVDEMSLTPTSGWDALGFRGTCSLGFELSASGDVEQVLPDPFAVILNKSMHPFAHLTWGSVWFGLATDAVAIARSVVRKKMLQTPDGVPIPAIRLSEVDELLYAMKGALSSTMAEYQTMLDANATVDAYSTFGFNIRVNNLKVTSSERLIDIVSRSLQIVGISGYMNDSSTSLSRHLRDAHGAALMVNNDRIRGHNAALQAVNRPS